jgi:hypothetical protein
MQFTKKPRRLTPVAVSSAMPLKDSGPLTSCQVQPGAGGVSREVRCRLQCTFECFAVSLHCDEQMM